MQIPRGLGLNLGPWKVKGKPPLGWAHLLVACNYQRHAGNLSSSGSRWEAYALHLQLAPQMPEEKEVRFAFVSCCSGASTLDQSSDLGTRIVEVSKSPPAPSAQSGNGTWEGGGWRGFLLDTGLTRAEWEAWLCQWDCCNSAGSHWESFKPQWSVSRSAVSDFLRSHGL